LLIAVLQSLIGFGLACHLPQELAQEFDEFVSVQLKTRQWWRRRSGVEQVGLYERACSYRCLLH
jgi:hypothetical protein